MSEWSDWLLEQLNARGWRQSDFVRESQGTIKRDRISKWAKGSESPTHRYAIIAANTLGVPHEVALRAAGYPVADEPADDHPIHRGLGGYTELDLLDELRRRARLREREN